MKHGMLKCEMRSVEYRECDVLSAERSLWSTEPALKRDVCRAGWGDVERGAQKVKFGA